MEFGTVLLMFLAGTSLISWFAAWYLSRIGWGNPTHRTVLGGLMPMLAILGVLVVGHIMWLRSAGEPQHDAYSPLIALIYGFWMAPIILASNFTASFFGGKGK